MATDPGFVHLHVHSAYSLLEGALTIGRLAEFAKADHQPALALTDTDNMFGALEFSEKLASYGIQPIVGCALALDFGDETRDPRLAGRVRALPRIVLLAAREAGYRSLMRLCSRAFLETPPDEKPHLKLSWLDGATDGLIALTGGPGGPLRHVAGPILHDGLIFAVSGDGGGDRHMVAIKADNSGDVTDSALVWEKKRGTSYVPMVLARGEHLFWVTDKENLAVCVDAKTGKEVWSERLGGRAAVTASPVMIDGKIYSVSEDGTVYVFAAAKEFDLLAKNELKEEVYASPAIADGRLYIRGTSHLFCIGAKK